MVANSAINFLKEARAIEPEIIKTRRAIHEQPELAYHEDATSKLVAEQLEELGIEVKRKVGGTGVLGVLRGSKDGKVVALRADMDALPLEEMADVEYKSKIKGVMHACGHDTHVAMLLGAAKILAQQKDKLEGTIKFLFQPAEEHGGRGGAKPMIEDGVMENPKVDYVFGLHIGGAEKSGVFAFRGGPIAASPDRFTVRDAKRCASRSATMVTLAFGRVSKFRAILGPQYPQPMTAKRSSVVIIIFSHNTVFHLNFQVLSTHFFINSDLGSRNFS